MSLSLSHTVIGDGPPLVILHGLFGSKRNWTSVAKALSGRHAVYCLDLRNHGDSPWDASMSYDAMAADVSLFIRKLDAGPVTLIGHSMGGKTAMTAALSNGGLIEKLVVVDIAPSARAGGVFADYVKAMSDMDVAGMKTRRDADSALSVHIPEAPIRAFLLQNLEPNEAGGFRWKPNLNGIGDGLSNILDFPEMENESAYEKPALFLSGGNSDYIGPQHAGEMGRLFPAHTLEVIPDAGHWLHAEKPAEFITAVYRFLNP